MPGRFEQEISEIDAALARGPFRLVLPQALETRFEAASVNERNRQLQAYLVILAALDVAALGFDTTFGVLRLGLLLRLGVVTPLIAVGIALLRARNRPLWLQGLAVAVPHLAMLTSIIVIAATMRDVVIDRPIGAAGILIFTINLSAMLRFRHAATLAVASVAVYVGTVLATLGATGAAHVADLLVFNSVIAFTTLRVVFKQERAQRNTFLFGLRDRLQTEKLLSSNQELQRLSATDGLTGLANRRAFDAGLKELWQTARDERDWLGLLMIDIDHFKTINDTAGHDAGDLCLRKVAEVIAATTNGSGLLARYGGEEFALVCPGADPAATFAMGERIRVAVAAGCRQERAPVTVSIGAAASLCANAGEHRTTLIRRADEALYLAKSGGRDQTTSADAAVVPAAHVYDAVA